MGCAHLLLGLPSDVQGKEETGTGPRALLPLLSSGGSSYAGNLKMGLDFEHGCLWVEEPREEVPGWGDGYQRRQETVQMPHPLPSTWLE